MDIPILTGKEDAATVTTTAATAYPIQGIVSWASSKTSEEFAFHPDAGKKALWKTYKKSEVEGEKGQNVTFPSLQFAIIATGFRVVNVDEVNKEYWQSSLCLDSRTDLISVWSAGNKIFDPCLYSELKAVMPKTAKYVTSLICVSLTKGNLFEIQAGQLLTESICQDATKFLGKNVNTFGLAAQPPLIFLPPLEGQERLRRMLKDGKPYIEGKSKGECFFSPIHRVGILPAGHELLETIKTQSDLFFDWANKLIKKVGDNTAALPETDHEKPQFDEAHEEKRKANAAAMNAQAPLSVAPTDGITVPHIPITTAKMEDSDDLPF